MRKDEQDNFDTGLVLAKVTPTPKLICDIINRIKINCGMSIPNDKQRIALSGMVIERVTRV